MSEPTEDNDDFSDPISGYSRLLAIILGVVFAGAGGAAVFVSKNQAGTVALLAVAAALLLIGIQGTPLVRLGSKDSSIELARIRHRALNLIERAGEEHQPDVAEAIAATVSDPGYLGRSTRDRIESAMEYEHRVIQVLTDIDGLRVTYQSSPDSAIDALVVDNATGRGLAVDIRPRFNGRIFARDLDAALGTATRAKGSVDAFLLVTSAIPTEAFEKNLVRVADASPILFGFEIWRNSSDDVRLSKAVLKLLRPRTDDPATT